MNILVDVDDTLTAFIPQRNLFIKKYIERKGLPYKIKDIYCTKSAEVADWPLEECCKWWHEEGREEQLKSKTQKNAAQVMQKIKEMGHNIIIVTARPDIYFPAKEYTEKWLVLNNIPYDKIITGKLDKKQAMIDNDIKLVIDDSVRTINYASELKIKSFMFTSEENKNAKVPAYATRVASWDQILELMTGKAE